MSRESFQPGKFPEDAVERFQRMDDVSKEFPKVDLRKILQAHNQDPFKMAPSLSQFLSAENMPLERMIELVDQARAGLMQAIGTTWRHYKELDVPEHEALITRLIEQVGYHPLDAIYEYIVMLFSQAARTWEDETSKLNPIYMNLMINAQAQEDGFTPSDVVIRGGKNGTDITLTALEVLQSRWPYEFKGESMPKAELDKSMHFECIWPLLSIWRKMKGGPIVGGFEEDIYDGYTTLRKLPSGNDRVVWNPQKAQLMQTSKGVWIAMPSEPVVEGLEERKFDLTVHPSRGYCPAASAYETPESRESVQMQAVERVVELARKYWLPRYEG